MASIRKTIQQVLVGPDVVVAFLFLAVFTLIAFVIPFQPVQVPGYLLTVEFGNGAVAVLAWYLLAVIAGTVSRHLRTRFGRGEWDSFGDAVFPFVADLFAVGMVTIVFGLQPVVLPVETTVTSCTAHECIAHTEFITTPNMFAVGIGIVLLVLSAVLIVLRSPLVANGGDIITL